MKQLIYILFLIPVLSYGQVEPKKGATQIIIKNTLSAAENYQLAASKALDAGFSIEKKDNDLFTIKTEPKTIKGRSWVYYINIRAKENEIILSSMAKAGFTLSMAGVTDTDEYMQVQYKGPKDSMNMKSFAELQKLAELFKTEIQYN